MSGEMSKGSGSKNLGILYCAVVYGVAVGVAVWLLGLFHDQPLLLKTAIADLGATVVVFGGSVLANNSSIYDPYWSVAPIFIVLYWSVSGGLDSVLPWRRLLLIALVTVWGARLTLNWLSRWQGLRDEDWRYRDLRAEHGKFYWPVSLFGIHLFPTILVFLGCLPLYAATKASAPLNFTDLLATMVTVAAVGIETVADRQLRRFRKTSEAGRTTLATGLWAHVRHPNYLGEVLFWWGLFVFGLAAGWSFWWTGIGALSITLLFVFISIPMIDRRMLERRRDYRQHLVSTPALFPRPRKKTN